MNAWYQAYLKSPWWRRRRASIIARADEHCEWCGRYCGPYVPNPDGCDPWYAELDHELYRQRLEVHHLTYARVGRELDSDLVAICEGCHDGATERDHFRKMMRAAIQEIAADASHAEVLMASFAHALALRGEGT